MKGVIDHAIQIVEEEGETRLDDDGRTVASYLKDTIRIEAAYARLERYASEVVSMPSLYEFRNMTVGSLRQLFEAAEANESIG